jgi:hypothetical protein
LDTFCGANLCVAELTVLRTDLPTS